MDEKKKQRIQKVLKPLLMCSVDQRYALFYSTKSGKGMVTLLNLEGSVTDVIVRVVMHLERFGQVEEFLQEFEKLPRPEWYRD